MKIGRLALGGLLVASHRPPRTGLTSDQQADDRLAALQRSASRFDLIPELVKTHAKASDGTLKRHLMLEMEFTEDGADTFVPVFRDTIRLAKLGQSDTLEGTKDGLPGEKESAGDRFHATPFQHMTAQQKIRSQQPAPPAGPPISLLIGFDDDGNAVYGHVAFDVPIKKGYLKRLGKQLEAMEDAAGSGSAKK